MNTEIISSLHNLLNPGPRNNIAIYGYSFRKISVTLTGYFLLECWDVIPQGSSHGTGHVVVTLTSYENPRNHKDDGECCDPLGPFLKYKNCLPCNTYFKLCVKDSFNKRAPCIGQATTRLLNKEERRFTIRNDFPFDSLAVSTQPRSQGFSLLSAVKSPGNEVDKNSYSSQPSL